MKTKIKIYNTASRTVEAFTPLHKDYVGMYSCGPTVYDEAHIGNLRAYIFNDLLFRFLKAAGYAPRWVMNITDIDDKMIARAKRDSTTIAEIAKRFEKIFLQDLRSMGILVDEIKLVRATEHMGEMKELAELLVKKGFAYRADDGIYFSVDKFKKYGQFAGIEVDTKKSKERIKNDTYDKQSPQDFALWKDDEDIEGPSTALGTGGRPGWHIECSVMSAKYLGQPFDIHTGGVDLVFPHHQNEVAQSEAAYGKPLAKYWLHNEHLLVEGAKMAKSAGNFFTLRDVLKKGYDPLTLRYVLLQAHYRSKLDFSWKAMEGARSALYGLRRFASYSVLKKGQNIDLESQYSNFIKALANDLNVPEALAVVFGVTGDEANLGTAGRDFLRRVDEVLGLDLVEELSPAVKALLEAIDAARQNRNYEESDKLREKLTKLGYGVENSPDGTYAVRL